MVISKKELSDLIKIKINSDKISRLSFDGKNLLTRIPKEVTNRLKLKKGQKINWVINKNNSLQIKILDDNG